MSAFEITQDEYDCLLRYAYRRCGGNLQDAEDVLSVAVLKLYKSDRGVEGSAVPLLYQGVRWAAAHLARSCRGMIDLSYGDGDMDNCDCLDGRISSSLELRPVEDAIVARELRSCLSGFRRMISPLLCPVEDLRVGMVGRRGRSKKMPG